MSSQNKEGLTFTIDSFTIERGKIKEFVLAIGDENPLYYDEEIARENGYNAIPVPPTFPTVIEMWGGLDFETLIQKLELNPLKVLHGEQEYQYIKDLVVGDTVSCVANVVSHIQKRRMDMITIEVEYRNEGQLALISKSTIIEMH